MPLVRRVDVHVHVDETGDEKPIPGVDHRCAGRNRRRAGGANHGHPIAVDPDGYSPSWAWFRSVDQDAANTRDHGFRNTSITLYFQCLEPLSRTFTNRVVHIRA